MQAKEGMPPMNELQAHLMAALDPSGWLKMVKVLEVVGGLLVAIPRTRAAGLLVLGPILVNILAYWIFLVKGAGLSRLPSCRCSAPWPSTSSGFTAPASAPYWAAAAKTD